MKRANQFLLLLVVVFFVTAIASAQANTEKRYIEVRGSAETLITPNEFTFKITLTERIEKKDKITIETQEENLKAELAKIGVDVPKDLTIFDLASYYISRKKSGDTLASKDFRLKLRDLEKIGKLLEIADRLNIAKLDLIDLTHTDLENYRKETKIEALKAAKAKAEYLLGAIGERVGKTLVVVEIDESPNTLANSNAIIGLTTGVFGYGSNTVSSNSQSSTTLNFSQIKLRYVVLAKFEIE